MKGSEQFKTVIKNYLDNRAKEDSLFAKSYAKENKNIDDCVNYILGEVQKSGCNGFADDEVYCMAVHYYDEDNIEVKDANASRVVVNHHVELTQEEINKARKEAYERIVNEQKAKFMKKQKPTLSVKREENPKVEQMSLF